MLNLSDPLPDEGVKIPILAVFTGVAGIPFLALIHSGSPYSFFKLFNDYVEFRVVTRQRRPYSSIKNIHIEQAFWTNNVEFIWHGTPFAFTANVIKEDRLLEVVRFLARKQIPLTPAAQMFLQNKAGGI